MAVTVRSYGVRKHWQRELPQEVRDQLWLAHRLREDLVELHRDYEQALAAIWSAHPQIAEVEARIATLDTEIEDRATEAAKERSAARTRRVDTATTRRLADAKRERREAKAQRKAHIGAVYESAGDEISAAADRERAGQKALYGTYCQQGVDVARPGEATRPTKLRWSVYNDVLAKHKVAVQRIKQARVQGRPAQLRHHRFNGAGSLYVQLQRQAGDPVRSPELLASGEGKWRNVLQVSQPDPAGRSRRVRGAGTVRMRVGPGHQEVPVRVHRPLPPDADVTGAYLVTRRIAGHSRATVNVVANVPDPTPRPRTSRPVMVLHLGWRHDGDGAVRVGTWRSTMPIRVPARLQGVVVARTDKVGEIMLPADWRAGMLRVEQVRSGRDKRLDQIRAVLVAHLAEDPPTEGEGWPEAAEVVRWRSPARFAALATRHRGNPPEYRAEVVAELEAWRVWDRRRWETEAHGRDKLLGRRRDLYAQAAAWLCSAAGEVVVDDTALPDLARRSLPGPDAAPTALEDAASGQRVEAAPGALRERLISTAKREGITVTQVPHTGITRTHYRCGHVNPADHDYTGRTVLCVGCGRDYDQDRSATLVMLASAGHAPAPGAPDRRKTAS